MEVPRERKRVRDPDAWINELGPGGLDHGLELRASAWSRFGDFRAFEAEVLPAGSAQLAIVPPFLRLSAELVASLLATERLHQFGLVDCWLAVLLACTCGQHLTISQAPLVS